MIISDLSYLNEIAEETVNGGTGWGNRYSYKFDKDIDVKIDVDVDQKVDVKGAYNELAFELTAVGYHGSGTETTVAQTSVYDPYKGGYISISNGQVSSYAR